MAEEQVDPVREWLETLASFNVRQGTDLNPPQWLLDNGIRFERGPLPKRVRRGSPKRCYWNSLELAMRGKGRYVYCEGMAIQIIPVDHAWCYDRETGLIVDKTWAAGSHYLGIPVKTAYAHQCLKAGRAALNDWTHGYPLVTGAVPPEVWRETIERTTDK